MVPLSLVLQEEEELDSVRRVFSVQNSEFEVSRECVAVAPRGRRRQPIAGTAGAVSSSVGFATARRRGGGKGETVCCARRQVSGGTSPIIAAGLRKAGAPSLSQAQVAVVEPLAFPTHVQFTGHRAGPTRRATLGRRRRRGGEPRHRGEVLNDHCLSATPSFLAAALLSFSIRPLPSPSAAVLLAFSSPPFGPGSIRRCCLPACLLARSCCLGPSPTVFRRLPRDPRSASARQSHLEARTMPLPPSGGRL